MEELHLGRGPHPRASDAERERSVRGPGRGPGPRRITVQAMPVFSTESRLQTRGDADVVDITRELAAAVAAAASTEGQASAFVRGSTAAITTMEFEPGGVPDLRELLDRLVPAEGDYEHNRLNHDTNSHAHQRASIIGASEVDPGRRRPPGARHLAAAVLIDFDDRPRERTVIFQVVRRREVVSGPV